MSYVYRRGGRFNVRAGLPMRRIVRDVHLLAAVAVPVVPSALLDSNNLSFELFASPDELFAALLLSLTDTELTRLTIIRDDQRTQSRFGTPVSFPVGPGSNRILQLRSTLWTASKSTDDFSKWLS